MPEKNLELNSLSRFSKQSPRLVLEEYSHCEVPAGCGGVVLRWKRAAASIPMLINYFSGNGRLMQLTFDGKLEHSHSRIPVGYGDHVLALTMTNFEPNSAIVGIVGRLNEDYVRILKPQGETTLLSSADGTWKYTLDQQYSEDWKQQDFDDSSWLPMIEKAFVTTSKVYSDTSHWVQQITSKGALWINLLSGTDFIRQTTE